MSDDLRTRLAALADEWEAEASAPGGHDLLTQTYAIHARDLRALLAERAAEGEDHPPCCPSCEGRGGTSSGPCWDCRGTGHAHAPTPAQPAAPSGDVEALPAVQFVKRLVGAWDCCGTCAGGVLAAHDAEVRANAARETAERIAGAIEDEQFATGLNWKARDAFADAARIARAEGDR